MLVWHRFSAAQRSEKATVRACIVNICQCKGQSISALYIVKKTTELKYGCITKAMWLKTFHREGKLAGPHWNASSAGKHWQMHNKSTIKRHLLIKYDQETY